MSIAVKVKEILRRDSWMFLALRAIYTFFRKAYEGTLSLLFRVFPIQKNKIVINNLNGKGYGDNSKYIVEELLENSEDLDIVWLLRDLTREKAGLPNKVRSVKLNSFKSIYEMTTAKIWLESNRLGKHLFKRKMQFYIQTWHGGLGLKKIGGDVPYRMDKRNIKLAKRDSNMADLYISNSKHLTDIYRRAFWYEGEILESGFPKNDVLFKEKKQYRERVRELYGLNENDKILLYAPTFRDGARFDPYDIDFSFLSNKLNNEFDQKWVFIAKLHPNIDSSKFYDIFPKEIINASSFPDMQELVLGIDALVTDYSSCMFDSAMAKIPTFLYASDIKSYVDERGFYFNMNELPFSFSENTENLAAAMSNYDKEKYQNSLKGFYKKVGLFDDGYAAEKVSEKISNLINS